MPVLGFVRYSVKIGDRDYDQEFIVIKQLIPEIILGRDFLSTYKLAITWGKEGALELKDEQETAILTTEEITEYPAVSLAKLEVPARTGVMIPVSVNLPPFAVKTLFTFNPHTPKNMVDSNFIVYPLDYTTIRGGATKRGHSS